MRPSISRAHQFTDTETITNVLLSSDARPFLCSDTSIGSLTSFMPMIGRAGFRLLSCEHGAGLIRFLRIQEASYLFITWLTRDVSIPAIFGGWVLAISATRTISCWTARLRH